MPNRPARFLAGALLLLDTIFVGAIVKNRINSAEPALEVPRFGIFCDEVVVHVKQDRQSTDCLSSLVWVRILVVGVAAFRRIPRGAVKRFVDGITLGEDAVVLRHLATVVAPLLVGTDPHVKVAMSTLDGVTDVGAVARLL
jgi:hypothetical protein